ncbi:HlyD family secretion protein [Terrimonas sp. NA20]|uniref:HlyD family secretion protein n=1 Tax=Terrimonas ginsenosidimutans TaxID=2908004 RepID=A0ABS9KK65_9BACT|nr:HlyD family efflux transporter periplasmic adaptor subunit [Terrimonas ginsenosidimutans]MCG2612718.1 HlyD family secretion protein [Terrimonas ginsenosidimutans]
MPSFNNQSEPLTDEVEELISYRPHWIVRKGNVFFLLVALAVLMVTWLIRYPDIIRSSARLVATNPPKQVIARAQGKLAKLLVQDNDIAKGGQHLAYIESTADYHQVMALFHWLNKTTQELGEGELTLAMTEQLPFFSGLGELQSGYQQFQDQLFATRQTMASGYFVKKQKALQQDLQYLANLRSHSQQQQQLQKEDRSLQEQEYDAYVQLAKEKVIAPLELNQYKSRLLGKDQNLEQVEALITNNAMSGHAKYKELLDLQKQVTDQQQQYRSSLLQLKSETEKWIQQYVLVAPDSGRVLFAASLAENQLISNGDPLFYIQPGTSGYYLELVAGQRGFGKIKKGQQVIVKIDGFPSEEFGLLTATINYVSLIPNRTDSFALKASLPNGLHTNYGKEIFFNNSLSAQADIVTDERRLIELFFDQLRKIGER